MDCTLGVTCVLCTTGAQYKTLPSHHYEKITIVEVYFEVNDCAGGSSKWIEPKL